MTNTVDIHTYRSEATSVASVAVCLPKLDTERRFGNVKSLAGRAIR
jgi:hypothetical protein